MHLFLRHIQKPNRCLRFLDVNIIKKKYYRIFYSFLPRKSTVIGLLLDISENKILVLRIKTAVLDNWVVGADVGDGVFVGDVVVDELV